MVDQFVNCLASVAPIYNLVLAAIVFYLFIVLFKLPNRNVYVKPWYMLFAAFCIFIVEEVLTVLRHMDILNSPEIMNGIFEMAMIGLFIYMLFLQKEYIEQTTVSGKKKKK